MFRAIEAFRLFDLVYILTGGGPGGTTETLSFNVYKVAFFGFDTGRASAYGILMVIVVIVARAALPALPQQAPGGAAMATHIQTEAVRRRGHRRRDRRRRPSAGGRGSAPASRSCCSPLLAVVMLFPVLWMLETSIKENRDIYAVPAKLFGFSPTLDHLKDVFVARASPVLSGLPELGRSSPAASTVHGHGARGPGGVGLLALHHAGQEGPAVLHPLDPLHAARGGRDPDLPHVPRPRAHRHASSA